MATRKRKVSKRKVSKRKVSTRKVAKAAALLKPIVKRAVKAGALTVGAAVGIDKQDWSDYRGRIVELQGGFAVVELDRPQGRRATFALRELVAL